MPFAPTICEGNRIIRTKQCFIDCATKQVISFAIETFALSRTFQFPIVRISRGLNEIYARKRTRCEQLYRAFQIFSFAFSRYIEDGALFKTCVFEARMHRSIKRVERPTCKSPTTREFSCSGGGNVTVVERTKEKKERLSILNNACFATFYSFTTASVSGRI